MKIAFYKAKNGTKLDVVVATVSLSEYSHCEIVFDDGMCASSSIRDGGIRFKRIKLDTGHWDIFELNTDISEKSIRYWFSIYEDNTYDWLGAAMSSIGINCSSEDKKYCSYACAFVLGLDPTITPGGLYRKLKKLGMISDR
jgi:hypothetical protein